MAPSWLVALILAALQAAAAPHPPPKPKATPAPPPVLEGRVVGPDGKPIDGAIVVARDEKQRWTEPTLSTRTDKAGAFRFALKTRRPHLVWAQAPGLAIARREGVAPGTSVVLRLVRGGTITGVVRDGDSGAPIEGAEVTAFVWGPTPDWEPGAGRLRAVSDREGRFRVDGVDRRAHVVRASARGYAEAEQQGVLAGREISLYLQAGGSVAGLVLDAEGQPAAEAVVHLSKNGPSLGSTARTADARGGFVFPGVEPGTYTLLARHPKLGIGLSPAVEVAEAEVRRDVILLPGVAVVGRLVDPEGEPVVGRVQVAEIAGEPAPLAAARLLSAEADADGRFRIEEVPLGPSALAASAPGFATRRLDFDARPGPRPNDVGEIALDPGLRVAGRVRAPDGSPIADARLQCWQRLGGSRGSAEATSSADGRFVLGGLAAGGCSLSITASGFAPSRMQVAAGSLDLDVVLAPAGRLAGLVVDEGGAPVPAFRVSAQKGDYVTDRDEDASSEDGRFLVEDVAEGTWTLRVTAPERAPAVVSEIVVRPGRTTDVGRVRLARGGSVRGQVVGPDELPIQGASLRAERPQSLFMSFGDEPTVTSDASGLFELRGLAAGKTDVVASHPRYAEGRVSDVEVDAARPAEVRIRLGNGGRIEGTARRRNGSPMGGAMIRVWGQGQGFTSPLSATVAPDGSFSVERVPAGPVSVNLMEGSGGGYSGVASKEIEIRDGETARVELVVASILVSGSVTRGGAPVVGARVNLRSSQAGFFYASGALGMPAAAGPQRGFGTSDENGHYELIASAPGAASASVESGEPAATHRFPEVEIPDAESHVLDLELGGAPAAGIVFDSGDRSPLAGAQVRFQRKPAGDSVSAATLSGPDGRFRVELEAGDYVVTATKEGYASESLDASLGGAATADLVLGLERGHEIRGRVLDASGLPFEGATVSADEASGAESLADGSFRLSGLKEGSYDLFAAAEGRGFASRPQVPAPSEGVVLQLGAGGRVQVTLRRPDGTPAAGAWVSISSVDGVAAHTYGQRAGEDGGSVLDSPLGSVTLVASLPGRPPAKGEATVVVKATETASVELVLRPVPED